MGISIAQLILVLVIIVIIFGAGKLPKVMGDVGKGVKNLKDGLKGDADGKEKVKTIPSKKTKSGKK